MRGQGFAAGSGLQDQRRGDPVERLCTTNEMGPDGTTPFLVIEENGDGVRVLDWGTPPSQAAAAAPDDEEE